MAEARYRITAALGAGGMGEVYRAIDTKLQRDVAIKVLPHEVAKDPERLGRFQREAHLLAAIYRLEEANGKPFLALEVVESEDLKERLARGAIPVAECLEIARRPPAPGELEPPAGHAGRPTLHPAHHHAPASFSSPLPRGPRGGLRLRPCR